MEARIVEAQIKDRRDSFDEVRRGQVCALVITLAALFIGSYTAIQGKEVAGAILGLGGVGGIVTAFLLGRSSSSKTESEEASPKEEQRNTPPKRNRRK